MSIILSHSSALHEWTERALAGWPHPEHARITQVPAFDAEKARVISNAYDLHPMHVLAPGASRRRHGANIYAHVWSKALPPGSTVKLEEGVYLSTPEFLFLQAAWNLDYIDLVRFGFELCALYTTRTVGDILIEVDTPLSTPKRIASYLESASGCPGVKQARNAIRHVLPRARSPREITFAMSLYLSRFRGGQGIRTIELNHRVDLSPRQQRIAGRSFYEVDIYQHKGKIGLEYYGREAHEGPVRTANDIRRESILLGERGIEIHGVTKVQSETVAELERFAKALMAKSGRRWHEPTEKDEARMRRLVRHLYWQGRDKLRESPWENPESMTTNAPEEAENHDRVDSMAQEPG